MSGKVLNPYQKGREESGVLPGGLGGFRRPSQRVGRGWEAHPNGREGFEALPKGRGVSNPTQKGREESGVPLGRPIRVGRLFHRNGRIQEALPEGQEASALWKGLLTLPALLKSLQSSWPSWGTPDPSQPFPQVLPDPSQHSGRDS